jgi:hypothetical protein
MGSSRGEFPRQQGIRAVSNRDQRWGLFLAFAITACNSEKYLFAVRIDKIRPFSPIHSWNPPKSEESAYFEGGFFGGAWRKGFWGVLLEKMTLRILEVCGVRALEGIFGNLRAGL